MERVTKLELLSPARDLMCGIEAIKHGADAVYIGASQFGARQAAGNSVEDIASLCEFAHLYGARVYVTLNTILQESELEQVEELVWQLYHVGVDAILVQDMAILQMNLPPIALHASTQCDVRTIEKVQFLYGCGFTRVVLARELSLEQIHALHEACPQVELECFVHGALCVSYSGQCYASQYCFGRSANRGECAQFCRLKFDLTNAHGETVVKDKHLLSLRDMNRIDYLDELARAGVCSFKIEGRLKDVTYVKNVTAAYSQALDRVIQIGDKYARASYGNSVVEFTPQLDQSFNRGFTDYFLHGRTDGVTSFNTPKSIGELMGTVKVCGRGWLTLSGTKSFNNGDGLCFFNDQGLLEGYRVNRVENGRIFLFLEGSDYKQNQAVNIAPGTKVYRNHNHLFEKRLSQESAVRKIRVDVLLEEIPSGFSLSMVSEDGCKGVASIEWTKDQAITPQADNIKRQLSKLGNTEFITRSIEIMSNGERFIPSSLLSDLRRKAVENLAEERRNSYQRPTPGCDHSCKPRYPLRTLTYLGNVYNSQAAQFYMSHGVESLDWAFEKEEPLKGAIMFCKHCIKHALGYCNKLNKESSHLNEPLFLQLPDGRKFTLRFDCSQCMMMVEMAE